MIKKVTIILVHYFFIFNQILGQINYNTSPIDLKIMREYDAIIKYEKLMFDRISLLKAKQSHHKVITILNEKGRNNYLNFDLQISSLEKLKKLELIVYDTNGRKIDKYNKNDFYDDNGGYYRNSISDTKTKRITLEDKNYSLPYTVDFKYEIETSNLLFYPIWKPSINYNAFIESSVLEIKTINTLSFNYRQNKINPPSIIKNEKYTLYTWEIKNIKSKDFNDYSPESSLVYVESSPKEFVFDGINVNLNSWEDFSSFYYNLNKSRDSISLETKETIFKLTQNITDTIEKIETVYNYLQTQTRYVSIQLGVGGWQTAPAIEVDSKKYGDCKALTNYMYALLKSVGIRSYPILIYAGDNPVRCDANFPISIFNHLILCVPNGNDTIWLECTSAKNPVNYLGNFTSNRSGLLITEKNGKLVHTKMYNSNQNILQRNAIINKDNAELNYRTSGLLYDKFDFLDCKDENLTQKNLKKDFVGDVEIKNYFLKYSKTANRDIDLSAIIKHTVSIQNSYIELKPNVFSIDLPYISKHQITDSIFYLNPNLYANTIIDSIKINLFEYKLQNTTLDNVNLKTKFGSFIYTSHIKDDYLQLSYTIELFGGNYNSMYYDDYIGFIKEVSKYLNKSYVIKYK